MHFHQSKTHGSVKRTEDEKKTRKQGRMFVSVKGRIMEGGGEGERERDRG